MIKYNCPICTEKEIYNVLKVDLVHSLTWYHEKCGYPIFRPDSIMLVGFSSKSFFCPNCNESVSSMEIIQDQSKIDDFIIFWKEFQCLC